MLNLSMRWALRGTWAFRRQLQKEMMAACNKAESQREAQLKILQEKLSLHEDSYRSSQTFRFHEDFSRVSVSETTHLYTKRNSAGRPHQVWKCETEASGNEKDILLFEEVNESSTVDVALTRDKQHVTINSNTRTSSEVHILNANDLTAPPLLVRPREEKFEYYMDHAHNQFYVFTNLGSQGDYKVMVARDEDPTDWQDCYNPKDGFVLQDMELFEKFVVLYGSEDLVPVIIVMCPENNQEPLELYCEEACHIEKSDNLDFTTNNLKFWLSSPTMHSRLYYCNDKEIMSCSNVANSSIAKYVTERVAATSEDGTRVPMTLVYPKDLRRDSGNPVLVHVYGCYGENLYTGFQPWNECLLGRGWILAYCHVRGGSELERGWYHAGQGRNKQKTFGDLHACVQHLHREGYSKPSLTALYGKSAGGMTAGMFCNQWPEMIQAAVLQVPFVNVFDSLSDPSLYLSAKDYEEFGNPNGSAEELRHIQSICPYSTLKPQGFPSMLVSASKADTVVPFSGVQKYIIRLKQCIQDHSGRSGVWNWQQWIVRPSRIPRGTILFHIDRRHGHHGSQDIHDKFKQAAVRIAFIYRALGLDV